MDSEISRYIVVNLSDLILMTLLAVDSQDLEVARHGFFLFYSIELRSCYRDDYLLELCQFILNCLFTFHFFSLGNFLRTVGIEL